MNKYPISTLVLMTLSNIVAADNYLESSCRKTITENFGISHITVIIDESEVALQSTRFSGDRTFEKACLDAFRSLLFDDDDSESPLALALDLCSNGKRKQECAREKLNHHISSATSYFTLIPQVIHSVRDQVFPPEHGERIDENWLFYVKLPTLSDHLFWVIVPRNGLKPVYNYGFN